MLGTRSVFYPLYAVVRRAPVFSARRQFASSRKQAQADPWTPVKDTTGGVYYWNTTTGETTDVGAPHPAAHVAPDANGVIPIDFDIAAHVDGQESQILIVQLQPQQRLRAEAGGMLYMTDGVVMENRMDEASGQGTDYYFDLAQTTTGALAGAVALGTEFPSKIIRIPLAKHGGALICQKGAFVCGSHTVEIEIEMTKKLKTDSFGGEGFILQRLQGSGDAFLRAGGVVIRRHLAAGELMRVSSDCIVAFEATVEYEVAMQTGEGLFLTTLIGPGEVILQGSPFNRVVSHIAARIPISSVLTGTGRGTGGDSAAGSLK